MKPSYRIGLVALLVGCASAPQVKQRVPSAVAASVARTWESLIDLAGTERLTIKFSDRASGLLQLETFSLADWKHSQLVNVADCGSTLGVGREAASMSATFVVRGDSSRATLQATADFRRADGKPCTSTGALERTWERQVRERAEGQTP